MKNNMDEGQGTKLSKFNKESKRRLNKFMNEEDPGGT